MTLPPRLALVLIASALTAALPSAGAPPAMPPRAQEVRRAPLDEAALRKLLADLGHDDIEVRDRASSELLSGWDEERDALLGDDKRLAALGADFGDAEVRARLAQLRRDGAALLLDRGFSKECRELLPDLARDILKGNHDLPGRIDELLACTPEDRLLALGAFERSVGPGAGPGVEHAAVSLVEDLNAERLGARKRGPALLGRLAASGEPSVRERALKALSDFFGEAREQAPAAERAVRDPIIPVRLIAIDCLAKIGDPAASARVFVELLDDESGKVRRAAVGGLIGVNAKDQWDRLGRLAADDPDPAVREKALYGLERLAHKESEAE